MSCPLRPHRCECAGRQEPRREGQCVRVDYPLQVRQRRVELLLELGNATLTIVMSSNRMNVPTMTAMSVHHFPFTGDLLRDYELDSARLNS
jgi:hypothetical protein